MFNHLIKNFNMDALSIPKQFKTSQSPPHNAQTGQDFERIVEVVLKLLSSALGERLGETVEQGQGEWRELSGELLRSRGMESQLVEVKQRYNDLAMRSSGLLQQAKRISSSVGEFITSINLFLDSEELLIPLKEIQKGITELSADRVEKQMRYLISIFEHNFTEAIQRRVTAAQVTLHEELKLLKNLNKNLEGELLTLKNSKNQEGSKLYELSLKVNTLNEKITKLSAQKGDLQRGIRAEQSAGEQQLQERSELQREVVRLRTRENELLEKLKTAETKASRSQRNLKEQSSEAEALNTVIERLKLKQEEISEQLEQEARKREANSETLRKKLQNEKIALEEQLEHYRERYSELEVILAQKNEETTRLKEEIKGIRERGDFEVDLSKPPSQQRIPQPHLTEGEPIQSQQGESPQKISLNELLSRLNTLQSQKRDLQGRLGEAASVGVNKEVLRSLFLSYDDESKEWAVRRNIKQQIYSLLDLRDRLSAPEDPKPAKWFGLF